MWVKELRAQVVLSLVLLVKGKGQGRDKSITEMGAWLQK